MSLKRIFAYLLTLTILWTTGLVNIAIKADDKYNNTKIICQATLEDHFADDSVIVVINDENSKINKLFTKEKFKGVELSRVEDLTYIDGNPNTKTYLNRESFNQIFELKLVKTGKDEVLKAIRKLEKLDFILAAEPNYYFYPEEIGSENQRVISESINQNTDVGLEDKSEKENLDDEYQKNKIEQTGVQNDLDENITEDVLTLLSTRPNDSEYIAGNQWGLDLIKAPQAWDITTGNSASTSMSNRVMVGVIDSGVADHPDLTDNVYWDMARDFFHDTEGKAAVIDDITAHGTNVAGVIGAKGNNSIGIAGICWDVAIVPLQVVDPNLTTNNYKSGAIAKAITYAKNEQIPIINCSFGGYGASVGYKEAIENYKGLIVCSAGNDKKNTDVETHMPSCLDLDNIISVAATKNNSIYLADEYEWGWDKYGNPYGSNYGVSTVDIAAPGTGIYTTSISGEYEHDFRGTSAAAPHVAGVAALILSVRPGLPGSHLRYLLTAYADGMGELSGKVANGAFLNASAAVNGALSDTVKITFNVSGGTCDESYRYYVNGQTYWDLPIPTRPRYNFAGWYTAPSGGTKHSETTAVSGARTLYAHWEVATYTIEYDSNGGDVCPEAMTIDGGSSHTITSYTNKEGRKFTGWKRAGDDKLYLPGDTITNIWENITFVAQWERIYKVLTYESKYFDAGTWTQTVDLYDTLSSGGKIPCSILEQPGVGSYVFQGWKIKGGDGTVYQAGGSGTLPGFKNYILEDTVSRWPKGEVTYNANGGQNAPEGQTFYYDDPSILVTKQEPTRAGYSFLGWAESTTGEVVCAPGTQYLPGIDRTLYAKWEQEDFVVRFDTGTTNSASVPAYNPPLSMIYSGTQPNTGITLPVQTPTRPGYTFKGWSYTNNGNSTVYKSGSNFKLTATAFEELCTAENRVIELTAVWERYPTDYLIAFVDLTEYGGRTDTVYLRNVSRGGTYGEAYDPDDAGKTSAFPELSDRGGYCFDGWADVNGNIITSDTPVTKEGFHYVYARWIAQKTYSDVQTRSFLSKCYHYGYMFGTGGTAFSPEGEVTRGVAVTVLHRLEGSPACGNNQFYDVKTETSEGVSNKTSEAVTWAEENSIVSGVSTSYFGEGQTVTIEQLAAMFLRYAKYKGVYDSSEVDPNCLDSFTDADEISGYAVEAMKWVVSTGIIGGVTPTLLRPKDQVNRLQLADFIIRMREMLIEHGKITTLKVNGSTSSQADGAGIVYKGLADNSWEQISAASEAGIAEVLWKVGDEKDIQLTNGERLTVQIYGFEHDDLTQGGKAGITFGLKELMHNARSMSGSATNEGGFTQTQMYSWLNGTLYEQLPLELRNMIKAADKKTAVGGGSGSIRTDSMKVFLFAEAECFSTLHHSYPGEGEQYEIFKDSANRIKVLEGPQILEWWERSPRASDTMSFCLVHSTGDAGYTNAAWPYAGVNFGFCV